MSFAHADTIDSIVDELIDNLKGVPEHQIKSVIFLLGQVKGLCNAAIEEESLWGLVREDYEKGILPRVIARKNKGVKITQIYYRANYEKWLSPRKINAAMQASKNSKKNVFYPTCRVCEQKFEAQSGHAAICPTCKAFELEKKVIKKAGIL